jgi:hypothetical protein
VEIILIMKVVVEAVGGLSRYSAVGVVGGSSAVVVVVGGSSAVILVVVVVGGSSAVVVVVVVVEEALLIGVCSVDNCPLVLASCGLGTAVTFCGHFYLVFKVYFYA